MYIVIIYWQLLSGKKQRKMGKVVDFNYYCAARILIKHALVVINKYIIFLKTYIINLTTISISIYGCHIHTFV